MYLGELSNSNDAIFVVQVLVVNVAMLVQHTDMSPFPIDLEFPTMVVGHMWTRQHGMDVPMSCLQVKVGHHLHPSFL
jgi:hypothetical protein